MATPTKGEEEKDAQREEAAEDPTDLRNPTEVTGGGVGSDADAGNHSAGDASNVTTQVD